MLQKTEKPEGELRRLETLDSPKQDTQEARLARTTGNKIREQITALARQHDALSRRANEKILMLEESESRPGQTTREVDALVVAGGRKELKQPGDVRGGGEARGRIQEPGSQGGFAGKAGKDMDIAGEIITDGKARSDTRSVRSRRKRSTESSRRGALELDEEVLDDAEDFAEAKGSDGRLSLRYIASNARNPGIQSDYYLFVKVPETFSQEPREFMKFLESSLTASGDKKANAPAAPQTSSRFRDISAPFGTLGPVTPKELGLAVPAYELELPAQQLPELSSDTRAWQLEVLENGKSDGVRLFWRSPLAKLTLAKAKKKQEKQRDDSIRVRILLVPPSRWNPPAVPAVKK